MLESEHVAAVCAPSTMAEPSPEPSDFDDAWIVWPPGTEHWLCLLCNKRADPWHLATAVHCKRVAFRRANKPGPPKPPPPPPPPPPPKPSRTQGAPHRQLNHIVFIHIYIYIYIYTHSKYKKMRMNKKQSWLPLCILRYIFIRIR
jgi:hypothetical protein